MAVSTADMLDSISKLTVMEIVDLIKSMEEKFGVTAAAPVALAAAPAAGAVAEEQTEFTVSLKGFPDDKKVTIIKVIREITGLGLKEAKDLVESAPCVVKESIPKADAEQIKKKLEEVGAQTEIK